MFPPLVWGVLGLAASFSANRFVKVKAEKAEVEKRKDEESRILEYKEEKKIITEHLFYAYTIYIAFGALLHSFGVVQIILDKHFDLVELVIVLIIASLLCCLVATFMTNGSLNKSNSEKLKIYKRAAKWHFVSLILFFGSVFFGVFFTFMYKFNFLYE